MLPLRISTPNLAVVTPTPSNDASDRSDHLSHSSVTPSSCQPALALCASVTPMNRNISYDRLNKIQLKSDSVSQAVTAKKWNANLDVEDIQSLVNAPSFRSTNNILWSNIQPQYNYTSNGYEMICPGVLSWQDLGALIEQGLLQLQTSPDTNGSGAKGLSFELHEYLLIDKKYPSLDWQKQVQLRLEQCQQPVSIYIGIRGDQFDPVQVLRINHADASWLPVSNGDNQELLIELAQQQPQLHQVYDALESGFRSVQTLSDVPSLHQVLESAIEHYNQAVGSSDRQIPHDKKTAMTGLCHQLGRALQGIAQRKGLLFNPLDEILSKVQRTSVGAYSVGGGQTLSLMSLVYASMDEGTLPLDTRLAGDNRSSEDRQGIPVNPAVVEIVEQNQRRSHLGAESFLTRADQAPIYMRPQEQRINSLTENPPQWLFLNVPTAALNGVLTAEFLDALAGMAHPPALVLSAKSFASTEHGVDIPATNIFRKLYAKQPGLQKSLIVLGGYFAAPWLLGEKPVHFVVAGKCPEVVSSVARIMPKQKAHIKFDECYGKSDQLFGTAIMGALKNQAVYDFARTTVRHAFNEIRNGSVLTTERQCDLLNRWSRPLLEKAIHDAEQSVESLTDDNDVFLTERPKTGALGFKAIKDFQCAPGVRTDFERCMIQPITPQFIEFMTSLVEFCSQGNEKALTNLLETVVDASDGFGSRNSRDGVIDEAIKLMHEQQSDTALSVQSARNRWTPRGWLAKTTEGRNGILPIIEHLSHHNKPIPLMIESAAVGYAQANPRILSFLAKRDS